MNRFDDSVQHNRSRTSKQKSIYFNRRTYLLFYVMVLMMWIFRPIAAGAQNPDTSTKRSHNANNAKASQTSGMNINLEEVELKEFIRTMSNLLSINFVVPTKIKGKVTVLSPKAVSRGVALSILESVLDVYGYSLIKSGEIYKVVDKVQAKTEGVSTHYGSSPDLRSPPDQIITQVLPLKFVTAREILTMFQPLVSKGGYITAHEPSNTLILTDTVGNVNRLKKILKNIDVEGSKSQLYHFRLQYADVEEVLKSLLPLFQESSQSKSAALRRAVRPKIQSLPYSHAGGGSSSAGTILVSDKRTNTLIASCSPETYMQLARLVNLLDVETPRARDRIRVYYLDNAVAEDVAEVLKKQVSDKSKLRRTSREPLREPLLEGVNITADKATNSLIITASPEDFEILSDVIAKLDVRRSQVMVEALIVETSLDKTRELGVEWRNMDAPKPDKVSLFGGTNLPVGTQQTGTLNQVGSDANPYSSATPAGLIIGAIKGPIYWGKNAYYTIGALARALQADIDVNILLTPHIITYDNEESEIIVGEERPYLKSSQTSTEGSVIRSFEYKDVGTTLRITPHISQGDTIRLDIFSEIKNFVEQSDIGAITTTKRQIKTSVQVDNGKTVVLGGIIKEDNRKSRSAVPCLGRIWGLGWLFKSQKGQNQKTNLLIFINPHIIKTAADMDEVTRQKKKEYFDKTGKQIDDFEVITPEKEEDSQSDKPASAPQIKKKEDAPEPPVSPSPSGESEHAE